MRFWDLSDPEIAAADAEPWSGPLSAFTRPASLRAQRDVWLGAIFLSLQAGVVVLVVALSASEQVRHPGVLIVNAAAVTLAGVSMLTGLVVLSPSVLRRLWSMVGVVLVSLMGVAVTVGLWASGPGLGVAAIYYVEALPFVFFAMRLPWAFVMSLPAICGCGLVMLLQDGWPVPGMQWLIVSTTVVAVGCFLGLWAHRSDHLADSEHAARLELAEVNHTLEERVTEQVAEIDRLGQLRRFLTPQVAEAVMSADAEALTRPHRQRIAVFFCDLRGFTAFTKDSEPEEVVANIDQYYRTAGEVLQRHGATIGGYAGDGIMAYLGDPVPHPEPAPAAVEMVTELRVELDTLVEEWRRRGHDLGYGIGLACGYATLGVVGFDGRYDYTPMGGVVNLAARLCGHAGPGQVLLDHATYAALDHPARCEPVTGVELKGLGPQRAYALV